MPSTTTPAQKQQRTGPRTPRIRTLLRLQHLYNTPLGDTFLALM